MIVLDSCTLVWWTVDPGKLSAAASAACAGAKAKELLLSAISIWEIGLKIKKGKLKVGATIEEYVARLKKISAIEIVPVDETILIANLNLSWSHRDPADRTIVATALLRDVPIVTPDQEIRAFYPKSIW